MLCQAQLFDVVTVVRIARASLIITYGAALIEFEACVVTSALAGTPLSQPSLIPAAARSDAALPSAAAVMSAALHSYRAFLRVVAAMPKQQRGAAVQQARSELAFFRDVSDPAEAARLVDAFDGRIAYLRMTTPRRPASQKGRTSIVYRNGEKVDAARERDKAKWSNWDGANMDPDSVARHNRSLRRAGFRDNAHAKGFF